MSDRYTLPVKEVPESEPETFREDEGVRDGGPGEESADLAPASGRARARPAREGKKRLANGRPLGSHMPRPSLNGKCSCEVFHARPQSAIMTPWQRTELKDFLVFRAAALLAETGGDTPRQAWKAWRIVAEAWLLESGEVVEKTNNVLPHSFGRVGS